MFQQRINYLYAISPCSKKNMSFGVRRALSPDLIFFGLAEVRMPHVRLQRTGRGPPSGEKEPNRFVTEKCLKSR